MNGEGTRRVDRSGKGDKETNDMTELDQVDRDPLAVLVTYRSQPSFILRTVGTRLSPSTFSLRAPYGGWTG